MVACALAAALALPAGASASVGSAYGDYAKDGTINGCDYSASDLQGALGSVPTDVAQYDPRFKNELNKALSQRASGCSNGGGSSQGSGVGTAGGGNASDGSPKPPAVVDTNVDQGGNHDLSSDRGLPLALWVLAALIALIVLGTAVVALRGGGAPAIAGHGLRSALSDYYWGLRDKFGR
jgi:hypothetical protein